MGTIREFEDLHAWQTARELTNLIYGLTGTGQFARDWGLKDQIRRAAASVMLNTAEGFAGGSDADFVKFLGYARRSASEVQAALYIALDQKYISRTQFDHGYGKALSCKKQINALISYLHKPRSHATKETPALYAIPPADAGQPDQFDQSNHTDQSDH